MMEGLLYLAASFWLGAVHAATPGHGKTIAASYIVGARGRPADALVLGVFVTLSHTSGIVLVALLATLGSAWLIPQRVEAYLAVVTGLLVVAIGGFMLRTSLRPLARPSGASLPPETGDDHGHEHHHHVPGAHGHDHVHVESGRRPAQADAGHRTHSHRTGAAQLHRHGWGPSHTHDVEALARSRPSLPVLLGLGIAGGLLPDPGALAILLSAIASGKLVLGLATVVVFSLGFASVLVVVGVVAARVGNLVLDWLSSQWVSWVQIGAALVILVVGLVLTASAWKAVAALN